MRAGGRAEQKVERPLAAPRMKRWFFWGAAAVLSVGACLAAPPKKAAAKAPSAAGTANNAKISGNEETWIVGDVARDLGQLVGFAAAKENGGNTSMAPTNVTLTPSTSEADGRTYTVQARPWNGTIFMQDFTVSGSPWEPGAYQPWAKSLAEAWGVRPQAMPTEAMTDDQLVALLSEPTMDNVLAVNGNLTDALTKTPASAGLHEQAALLLMLVVWAEPNSDFCDSRELIDSASAHLAMAKLLREGTPAGMAGRLAEASLLEQIGRGAEASQKLNALAATPNLPHEARDWVSALQLDNWGDWRKITPGADATLLLDWEYYGKLAVYTGGPLAQNFFDQMAKAHQGVAAKTFLSWDYSGDNTPQDLSHEKWRIAKIMHALGRGPEPAPEEGGRAAPLLSISALAGAWGAMVPAAEPEADTEDGGTATVIADAGNTTSFLNEIHAGPWQGDRLMVVTPGEWGALEQRNLMALLGNINDYLRTTLQDPKAAAQFRKQEVAPRKGILRLGPLLGYYLASNQAQYDTALAAAGKFIAAHPEWTSAAIWRRFRAPRAMWKTPTTIPDYGTWFDPFMPEETTFDSSNRMYFPEFKSQKPESFRPWMEVSPDNENVKVQWLMADTGGKPTAEQIRKALGPIVDYSVTVGLMAANACLDDIAAYQKAMQTVCDLNATFYLMMGRTLQEHGQEAAAAAAFQKAVDHFDDDPITMSNGMDFLVNYYFDHNRQADAMTVAQRAADVGSANGMLTLARLYARMGNFAQALKIAQQEDRAYGGGLGGKFMVYAAWGKETGDTKAKRQADQLWGRMTTGKLQQTATLNGMAKAPAPTEGVQVQEENYFTKTGGLQTGDIIVAIDGRKVRSLYDANIVLGFSVSSDYPMIFWRDGQYLERVVNLPERTDLYIRPLALKSYKSKGGA
jgi:hypothetical protein